MQTSYVYILQCSDESFYIGVTSDLTKRMHQHDSGFYLSCYTFKRRPLKLVYYAEFSNIIMAIDTEKQIKKWSRAKRLALIKGDFDLLSNLSKKKF